MEVHRGVVKAPADQRTQEEIAQRHGHAQTHEQQDGAVGVLARPSGQENPGQGYQESQFDVAILQYSHSERQRGRRAGQERVLKLSSNKGHSVNPH